MFLLFSGISKQNDIDSIVLWLIYIFDNIFITLFFKTPETTERNCLSHSYLLINKLYKSVQVWIFLRCLCEDYDNMDKHSYCAYAYEFKKLILVTLYTSFTKFKVHCSHKANSPLSAHSIKLNILNIKLWIVHKIMHTIIPNCHI